MVRPRPHFYTDRMWRPALARAGLVAASFAFVFGLLEIGARWMLPAPPIVTVERLAAPASDFPEQSWSVPFYPERSGLYLTTPTGLRLRPNTHVRIEGHRLNQRTIELRTNSLGYRNPEIGPKQGRRILFLGDSITLGDYLHEEETFVRLVEREAAARNESWETVNAGVAGISLADELAILVETGLSIEPDVVVVGFYLNDFEQSPGVHPPRLPRGLRASRVLALIAQRLGLFGRSEGGGSEPRRETVRAWRVQLERDWPAGEGDFRRDPEAFNALIQESARDWGGAWTSAAWERFEPLLEELRRLSDRHLFDLALVAFPVRQQVEAHYLYDHPQQRLRAVAARLEVPLLDLLPVLRSEWKDSGAPLFYDHCHHTPRGNRIIARTLDHFLAGLLAPGSHRAAR